MLMTRTLTALTLVTSLLVYGRLMSASHIVLYWPWIFKFPMPEIWRLVTSFWLTSPALGILFDTYFRKIYENMQWQLYSQPPPSMDVFKWLGKRITTLLPAWRLFHIHHLPRVLHPGMLGFLIPISFMLMFLSLFNLDCLLVKRTS